MINKFFSSTALCFLCLSSACAATRSTRANSGIDFQLKLATEDPSGPRPEGVFHVRGIDNEVSVYVPAAPLDPGDNSQRVRLPPGSYSISYSSVVLDGSASSLRNRAPAKLATPAPFFIVVGENQFRTINVYASDGSRPELGRAPSIAAQ